MSPAFHFSALNVVADNSAYQHINGVVFAVDDTQLEYLSVREHGYKLVETVAYDFANSKKLHDCLLYSAPPRYEHRFDFDNPAQRRYLDICLDGARSHGKAFYQQFLETTYIEDTRLLDLSNLLNL